MRGDPLLLDEFGRNEVGEFNAELTSITSESDVANVISSLEIKLNSFWGDLTPRQRREQNIIAVKRDNARLHGRMLRRLGDEDPTGHYGRHGSSR